MSGQSCSVGISYPLRSLSPPGEPVVQCLFNLLLALLFQDYYSIPFPTPTTPLTGRDGSLSSNPYSGREIQPLDWMKPALLFVRQEVAASNPACVCVCVCWSTKVCRLLGLVVLGFLEPREVLGVELQYKGRFLSNESLGDGRGLFFSLHSLL